MLRKQLFKNFKNMTNELQVTVDLINNKVQFTGKARTNPPIQCDYFPPIGDAVGYTGLELLLMSLSVCSSTAVVHLLRKAGKEVTEFQVKAKGIRNEELPMAFHTIFLDFQLTSPNTDDETFKRIIKFTETSSCPVWAMLRNNVEIVPSNKIINK